MAQYRIHRIKDTPRETFRWAAHTGGLAVVKPKDYEPDGLIEAATTYAAWRLLQSEARPLRPGDLLETVTAFDEYRGSQVPEGRKSVAFGMTFRSPGRTLTDAEVDQQLARVRTALSERHAASFRT